jgi:hypothetical protein
MAKLIKCPRCQAQIDVSNVPGGSTVRCSDCDSLVKLAGGTGPVPRAEAPAPEPAPVRSRGRQTDLFRKMNAVRAPGERGRPPSRMQSMHDERGGGTRYRRSGSNAGLVIGGCVAGAALIIVLVVALSNKKEPPKKPPAPVAQAEPEPEPQPVPAAAGKGETPKKAVSMTKKAGGYEVINTFEAGAQKTAERTTQGLYDFKNDEALRREYEAIAMQGKVAEIVQNDSKWIAYIIEALINDDEKVARSSFQALHDICKKRNISASEEGFKNPITMEYFNSAYYRGNEYVFWSHEWWSKSRNQSATREWAPETTGAAATGVRADAATENWDALMRDLRVGGGFDDLKRPEGMAFAKVKSMGRAAYPHLVKYIDNEDIALGKAAVVVLNELTGQKKPLPTEANKAQVKAEWDTWTKSN